VDKISAPWTMDQVDALNRYQRQGSFHPFTCGGERGDAAHKSYAQEKGDPDWGLLVATPDGWICPVCGYRQDWAHGFMAADLPATWPFGSP
jgi:hypothetical protein